MSVSAGARNPDDAVRAVREMYRQQRTDAELHLRGLAAAQPTEPTDPLRYLRDADVADRFLRWLAGTYTEGKQAARKAGQPWALDGLGHAGLVLYWWLTEGRPAEPSEPEGERVAIWSGEHQAWWRADSNGYTADPRQAGDYTIEDARRRTRHCGPEKQISIQSHPMSIR